MEGIRKQAEKLKYQFQDRLDQPDNETARQLRKEIEWLLAELDDNKNPSALEDRLKRIIRLLDANDQQKFMDYGHADDLRNQFEDMRQQIDSLSLG